MSAWNYFYSYKTFRQTPDGLSEMNCGHGTHTSPERITGDHGVDLIAAEIKDRIVNGGRKLFGTVDPAAALDLVQITALTLLAAPADQLDDDEWRHERAVAAAAREVTGAWAGVSRTHRTLIGDQMGFTDLANALDGLLQAVRGA